MHRDSDQICVHTYPDFQFSLISGPIHNHPIPSTKVLLCITLSRLVHLDRIDFFEPEVIKEVHYYVSVSKIKNNLITLSTME
jgi:hypothetical protein